MGTTHPMYLDVRPTERRAATFLHHRAHATPDIRLADTSLDSAPGPLLVIHCFRRDMRDPPSARALHGTIPAPFHIVLRTRAAVPHEVVCTSA